MGRERKEAKSRVPYRVLLLLNVQLSPVLERPLHNIRLGACTFDSRALLKFGPKLGEVLELDEVPNGAEGGFNDGGLADGGGGWNGGHIRCR